MNSFREDAQVLGGAGYGGFGGYGGAGLLEGLIFASLLGGRRGGLFGGEGGGFGAGEVLAGDIAAKTVALQDTADLKAEVKGVEAGIRETLFNNALGNANEFRGLERGIDRAALDAVKAQFEAKIAALEASQAVKNQLTEFQVSTDKQFCAVNSHIANSERNILDRLTLDKIDSKNDEIAQLRDRNARLHSSIEVNANTQAILSTIHNQSQALGSKIVQVGTTGSTAAIPSSQVNA